MKYHTLTFYSGPDEFETKETLIDHATYIRIQEAMHEGRPFISVKDRLIKSSLIKEIAPANDIVQEYLAMGISLASLGLPEAAKLPAAPEQQQTIDRLGDMKRESGFGKPIPKA